MEQDPGSNIQNRLSAMRKGPGDMVKVSEITGVVESVMATMRGDLSAKDLELFNELQSLANYIHEAKADIAALRPDKVRDKYIPMASDELDAIVQATENATNTIMDATETVERVMPNVEPMQADQLAEATTAIYEACGFQDITGQRITKVVKTLKDIEEKIDSLVTAFGSEIDKFKADEPDEEPEEDPADPDAALLGGPQQESEASTQEEIDALLASFD